MYNKELAYILLTMSVGNFTCLSGASKM